MKSFKEFIAEQKQQEQLTLFEHKTYKRIPNTKNSYREDPGNTNTMTQKHSHVYAKSSGKGSQLYAVNYDGSGHDGNSGKTIPSSHADFFRDKGYSIDNSNILECLEFESLDPNSYTLLFVENEV